MRTVHGEYFYGNKISDYGLQNGYVDYRTLAKSFDAVLNNDIMQKTWEIGYWEQESGFVDNEKALEELRDKVEDLKDRKEDFNLEFYDAELEEIEKELAELEEQIDELENEQNNPAEIFQYYIVSDNGADILKECNEIVFYNEELDMYVWGVTHWGTSWDYVLTDIKIEK